jgi:CRP-like cAMP-binding protein
MIQHFCSPWISAQNTIWQSVLHLGQRHYYNKGSIIIGNNQSGINHFYFLQAGRVKYSSISLEGNEKILWYLEKGNIFGEVPFFDRKIMENVFTATEKCEVYLFSRQCFHDEILPKYPELVVNLLKSMANKTRVVAIHASDLASLVGRVSKALIYLVTRENANQFPGRTVCTKGISQQELACILGVHRVTLNNAIAQLKQEGIIGHLSKSRLVINDYGQLLKLAEK